MKLYHFNPEEFDNRYVVMAENIIIAHECLLKFLLNKSKIIDSEYFVSEYLNLYELWKDVDPLDIKTIPESYTIQEYNANEIIETYVN